MFKRGKSKSSKQTLSFSHSPIFLHSSAKPKPVGEYCQCASKPQNLDLHIEKVYHPEEKGSRVPVQYLIAHLHLFPRKHHKTILISQKDPNPLLEELRKLTIAFNSSTEKHETQLTKFLENQHTIATEIENGGNAKIKPFTGDKMQDIGTWLAKFAYFSEFNNWSAKRKANTLPLYLGGSAQIYYNNLDEVTKNYYAATLLVDIHCPQGGS